MHVVRGAVVVLALAHAHAYADGDGDGDGGLATSPARPGYAPTRRVFDSAARADLEERGFRWDLTYDGEMFVAPQLDDKFASDGLFVLELDLDAAKLVADGLGQAHIAAFGIHGHGFTGDVMDIPGVSISGNMASPDVRLFEAWYEQPVGAFTLRGGLLAADQEYVLADESTTLINATFGITSQFSANTDGPVYPVATPGLSGRLELEAVTVRGAVYNGTHTNTHGIPTALGPGALLIGEAQIADVLKVGAWHDTIHGNGYYAIADAQLERYVGAFARAGISPDQLIYTYIDAGIRIGPGPFRPEDMMSVGIVFANTERGTQTVVEATYEAQLRWITIQPDVQLLLLSGVSAIVFGTRVGVAF